MGIRDPQAPLGPLDHLDLHTHTTDSIVLKTTPGLMEGRKERRATRASEVLQESQEVAPTSMFTLI